MAAQVSPPAGTGWSPPRTIRNTGMTASLVHIVGVPLIILAAVAVGFVTVILKDVLLPFVISIFLVYLLRPLVNVLTTPFSHWCGCLLSSTHHGSHHQLSVNLSKSHVGASSSANGYSSDNANSVGDGDGAGTGVAGVARSGGRRPPKRPTNPRSSSPAKMPKTLRSFFAYAYSSMSDFFTAARGSGGNGGGGGGGGAHSGGSGTQSSDSSSDQQLACCCGVCRMTRCPRWFAILVALSICVGCLGIFVLVIADAIQRFQHESLNAFVDEAGALINRLQRWLAGFGISLEGAAILDALKQQVNVPSLVKTTVTVIIDGIGNGVLILLLVLYLLAEQSSHVAGSLRARLDDQIQRYIGIKTVISLAQGLLVYIILGWFLGVRMAHLFGVIHFILNFIPTAGPIVATIVPMPLIILDPTLSVGVKIASFVGPTLVHTIVGNVVEPLVFGSSMELHPVTVLLALALWYSLWGISGAILAVPITAVIRIVMEAMNHPYARVVVAVMEGRIMSAVEETNVALDITSDGGDMDDVERASPTRPAASTRGSDIELVDADSIESSQDVAGNSKGRIAGGIVGGIARLTPRNDGNEEREGLLKGGR